MMRRESEKELKVFNNQFAVLKKLSAGSFGVVFRGLDKKNSQPVAIKVERREYDKSSLDHEVIRHR